MWSTTLYLSTTVISQMLQNSPSWYPPPCDRVAQWLIVRFSQPRELKKTLGMLNLLRSIASLCVQPWSPRAPALCNQAQDVDIKTCSLSVYISTVDQSNLAVIWSTRCSQHERCRCLDGSDPVGCVTIPKEEMRTNEILPERTLAGHMDADGHAGRSRVCSCCLSALGQWLSLRSTAVLWQPRRLESTVFVFYTWANVHWHYASQ